MSIFYDVLGGPCRDNAVLARVDSGQSVSRLLFDCGQCFHEVDQKTLQQIDHLFFSHLHMDHVAGFDSFFRCTFERQTKENHIWGPEDCSTILQHRFQGFLWNLKDQLEGTWYVHEFDGEVLKTWRFELKEGFETRHFEGEEKVDEYLLVTDEFKIKAFVMEHLGPCLAYLLIETDRTNFDEEKLKEAGIPPGPWLGRIKDEHFQGTVEIGGEPYDPQTLRNQLLVRTRGETLAYLTDFLLDEESATALSRGMADVDVMICEAQYRHADLDLARKNYHMTTVLAAELAKRAQAKKLILFHLSGRYPAEEWPDMLAEAEAVYPNVSFPDHWQPVPLDIINDENLC